MINIVSTSAQQNMFCDMFFIPISVRDISVKAYFKDAAKLNSKSKACHSTENLYPTK